MPSSSLPGNVSATYFPDVNKSIISIIHLLTTLITASTFFAVWIFTFFTVVSICILNASRISSSIFCSSGGNYQFLQIIQRNNFLTTFTYLTLHPLRLAAKDILYFHRLTWLHDWGVIIGTGADHGLWMSWIEFPLQY